MINPIWIDNLPRWLCNDADAVAMVRDILRVAEVWDDMIDNDKPLTTDDINGALYIALVNLPRNCFYQRNFREISPLVESAIMDWMTANEFEKSGDKQKLSLSYGLRFTPLAITTAAARILGGVQFAKVVNAECRALVEPWDAYAIEHGVT
jgi:hypothetical protein